MDLYEILNHQQDKLLTSVQRHVSNNSAYPSLRSPAFRIQSTPATFLGSLCICWRRPNACH